MQTRIIVLRQVEEEMNQRADQRETKDYFHDDSQLRLQLLNNVYIIEKLHIKLEFLLASISEEV